jgi:hypothetical protein
MGVHYNGQGPLRPMRRRGEDVTRKGNATARYPSSRCFSGQESSSDSWLTITGPPPSLFHKWQEPKCTTGTWPHAAKLVISVLKKSSIEGVRALPLAVASHSEYHRATLQEATLSLGPFPLPGTSQQQLGVEGAFKQATGLVRLCGAEQVKYARLQHRL